MLQSSPVPRDILGRPLSHDYILDIGYLSFSVFSLYRSQFISPLSEGVFLATQIKNRRALLYASKVDMRELLDAVSEITFDLACEHGELIEVVLLNENEFKDGVGTSPFLWEVIQQFGELFVKTEKNSGELGKDMKRRRE